MELWNKLSVPIDLEFDDGSAVGIPAGRGVRVHVGLLTEPRVTFEPSERGCRMHFHWGTNPVRIEELPEEKKA